MALIMENPSRMSETSSKTRSCIRFLGQIRPVLVCQGFAFFAIEFLILFTEEISHCYAFSLKV